MKLLTIFLLAFSSVLSAQMDTIDNAQKALMLAAAPVKDSIQIFTFAKVMPKYAAGADSLKKYVQSSINYHSLKLPKGFKGLMLVRLVVTPNGNVIRPEVHRKLLLINEANGRYETEPTDASLVEACEKEVLRVAGTLHFIPGSQNGKPVYVYYNLPVYLKRHKKHAE